MKGLFESQYKLANPGKPIPSEREWDLMREIADQIMDNTASINVSFNEMHIGRCHAGVWQWHIPNCNTLNKTQSNFVPIWERFDYIWYFVTNNIAWHPGLYAAEQDVVWSEAGKPVSVEFLTFLFMIDRYVWKKRTKVGGFNY